MLTGQAAAAACQPNEEPLIWITEANHWTLELAISDENLRMSTSGTTSLPLYEIDLNCWYIVGDVEVTIQIVNMSLYLNILNIMFDSWVCCYALFMLYYIVGVLSAVIGLTIVPKETFRTKLDKRHQPGETVDKCFDLKYHNNYRRWSPCRNTARSFLTCPLEVNFHFFLNLFAFKYCQNKLLDYYDAKFRSDSRRPTS